MIKFQKETAVKNFLDKKMNKISVKKCCKIVFRKYLIMKFQIETAVKSFVSIENERI